MKFVPASGTILLGSPHSENVCLHVCSIRLSVLSHSTCVETELTMVISNAKIVFAINGKDVSSNGFLQPASFWDVFLGIQDLQGNF